MHGRGLQFGVESYMGHKIAMGIVEITSIYFGKRVPRAASALSYSLVFTLFPLLICINAMLGSLNLTQGSIVEVLTGILPVSAVELISTYFAYISETSSTTPLFFVGLIATLTSSATAFRSIINTMYDMHGGTQRMGFLGIILSFVMSVAFLAVIYVSCAIIVCGKWLMRMIEEYFDIILFIDIWKWLRFVILFVVLFVMLYIIYRISSPKGYRRVPRARGAFIASILLEAISIASSQVISFSTRYTLVYGSLASIIVLLSWLYATGCVVFLGNIINVVIYNHSIKS